MYNDKKKVDVVDWSHTPGPIVISNRTRRASLSPTAIGVLGTVLIHALIVQSAYFGKYGTKMRPPKIQELGAPARSSADPDANLVLITLPARSNLGREIAQEMSLIPVLSKSAAKSPIDLDLPAISKIEILTLEEEQPSQASTAGGDGAEQARLFGIYTGQIQARIDRVWRRPRTAVSESNASASGRTDESFQCEAQIVQDVRGNVQEILLPRCNGSSAWQLSLVTAIREASPLPAPPSESVFSHSIALNFVGLAYASGTPEDGYQTAPRQSTPSADLVVRTAPKSNFVN